MLKVYFTASTSSSNELRGQYEEIVNQLKQNEVHLLSGEQIINKSLLSEDQKLTKTEIYLREKSMIDDADCIVAEVSKPSLGVGAEVDYALQKNKSVLALVFDPDSIGVEDKISPIIAGNPSENLFIEYYNRESLPFTVNDFLKHVETIKNKKGKLIVIEGADGSGKATQGNLLVSSLKEKKIPVKYIDFPRYYPSFHGKTVAKFLRGDFGSIDQVSPYLASLAYSLDRASVKDQMEDFMAKGGLIVANRYATSNFAHQAAKFKNVEEKEKFLKWVNQLEYKVHKIPKEDLVIYLYVPWKIGMQLTTKRTKSKYLEGKEDIHEQNIAYRQEVEKMYLSLAEKNKHWVKIDCVENNELLSIELIHKKILQVLKEKEII